MTIPNFLYDSGEVPFFTELYKNLLEVSPELKIRPNLLWTEEQKLKYPKIFEHAEEIDSLFVKKYLMREIGSETTNLWINYLNLEWENALERFNELFNIRYSEEFTVFPKQVDTISFNETYEDQKLGNNTTERTTNNTEIINHKDEFEDTPSSQVSDLNYLTNRRTITNNNSSNGSDNTTLNKDESKNFTRTITEKYEKDNLMDLIERYEMLKNNPINPIEVFVDYFDDLFINILARL